MRKRPHFIRCVLACFCAATLSAAAPSAWEREGSLVFTDAGQKGVREGIGTDKGERFLAFDDSGALNERAARLALPLRGGKLFRGEPFTILAVGDSVTATGPYPEILARLLARATGNENIRVTRAAYPGKSADAAVRRWASDGGAVHADLVLIMFGLNDQAAGSSQEAYAGQIRWLARRVRADGGDVILMEPTPHINILTSERGTGRPPPEASVFRVIGFAGALRALGAELGVPVAATFDALWQGGAPSLTEEARLLWPFFPAHYSKPFSSLVETGGEGDTIHPNAYGHLLLARAVFKVIAGDAKPAELCYSGKSRWTEDRRLVSRIEASNVGAVVREGRLEVYPYPSDDRHESFAYRLGPGETAAWELAWPGVARAEDLFAPPAAQVFSGDVPFLQVVDVSGGGSRVTAVAAPPEADVRWVAGRWIEKGGTATVRLRVKDAFREAAVRLPDEPTGRVVLTESADVDGRRVFAVGRLDYARFAGARGGEAEADADLAEWSDDSWLEVGPASDTDRVRWAFRAGRDGMWAAFRAEGGLTEAGFTLLFDTRDAAALGTAGPYTWVQGSVKRGRPLELRAGDSSPAGAARGLAGTCLLPEGGPATGEIFVPYAAMGANGWPASGDLGLAIVWTAKGPDGRMKRGQWPGEGHPWNTLGFGVARRDPTGPLPHLIRVR